MRPDTSVYVHSKVQQKTTQSNRKDKVHKDNNTIPTMVEYINDVERENVNNARAIVLDHD